MDQDNHFVMQSPGEMLKTARSSASLSQEDIANKLNLSVSTIIDIENDDYSRTNALIYVQGYLKLYARCVGLSQEMVLAAYDGLDIKENEGHIVSFPSTPVLRPPSPQFKNNLFRIISWGIGCLLILLIVMWWHGQRTHQTSNNITHLPQPGVQTLSIHPQQSLPNIHVATPQQTTDKIQLAPVKKHVVSTSIPVTHPQKVPLTDNYKISIVKKS